MNVVLAIPEWSIDKRTTHSALREAFASDYSSGREGELSGLTRHYLLLHIAPEGERP